jgi:hypothetical protein
MNTNANNNAMRNVRNTRKMKNMQLPEYATTMDCIREWYEHKFKKLGWMLLAKAKGQESKIAEYKRGIDRLLKSIEHVQTEYVDPDKIHDLRVLHMNTQVLFEFVNKNF